MNVLTVRQTMKMLQHKLDTEKRFTFLRYGDGRILMMGDKWQGEPTDHSAKPKLVELLRKAFKVRGANYMIGVHCDPKEEEGMRRGTFGKEKNDQELQNIVKETHPEDRVYYSAVPYHYFALFEPEETVGFIRKLAKKKVVVVGGEHLHQCAKYFDGNGTKTAFIKTPTVNAFDEAENIYKQIVDSKPEVVILGAGMCSAVLQYWLYQEGREMIVLDFGSLLDAMLGLQTRQWIKDNLSAVELFRKLL